MRPDYKPHVYDWDVVAVIVVIGFIFWHIL
jgi:hypothetical protein